jgi:hypothetical protein
MELNLAVVGFIRKIIHPGTQLFRSGWDWMGLGVQIQTNVSGSLQPDHINKSPLFWSKRSKTNCVDPFPVSTNT